MEYRRGKRTSPAQPKYSSFGQAMLFLGAPLGVPAVSPRYWHHVLQPAHTTELSAADGSVPTRHRLPPTYRIAEDGESHSMDLPQANITAVSAWTKTDAAWCVSSEHCDENGGGMQSVEVASTLSHLKAVATAWADGVQAALIVEGDASFAHARGAAPPAQPHTRDDPPGRGRALRDRGRPPR